MADGIVFAISVKCDKTFGVEQTWKMPVNYIKQNVDATLYY